MLRASSAESSRIFWPRLEGGTSPRIETALALGKALLDLPLHLRDAHLDPLQRLDRDAFSVLQEREDDVLGQELVGMEALGLLLRQYGEYLLCPLRQTFEHGVSLPSRA